MKKSSFLPPLIFALAALLMASSGMAQDADQSPQREPAAAPTAAAGPMQLLDKTISGTSNLKGPVEARREIQEKAAAQVTEELAREILGEEKYGKNRSLINSKVVRSSARFIPISNPAKLTEVPGGFTMDVVMKVNLASLRQVLQENGLLNENETAPLLLPLISIVDKVNLRTDRWWLVSDRGAKTPLRGYGRLLENSLRQAFSKSGFYMIRPIHSSLAPAMPRMFNSEKPAGEDLQLIGDWFGAPLVVEGLVQMIRSESSSSFRLEVRLSVTQISNGRPVADVSRIYETEAGVFDVVVEKKLREVADTVAGDLASQVFEAWQKGSVGSSQMRLTLVPRPALPDIEAFKERMKSSSVGIRTIRERHLTNQSVVFEVDSPITAKDLAGRLQGFDFNGKKGQASATSDTEIRLSFGQ